MAIFSSFVFLQSRPGECVSSVGEKHFSLGICVFYVGEHISLGISVSFAGEQISLGICVSLLGEHISLGIFVFA